MSNTPKVNRDSERPLKVQSLSPKGQPKARTQKLSTGRRDPRRKGR